MLQRLWALIAKELAALWKDHKVRMVILVPPLVQVVLFAYAANYDVTNVALGIWNEDRGAQSAELVRQFTFSPAFRAAALVQSPTQAADAIDSRRVAAVLHIPQRFSADLLAGHPAPVQLLVDGRRSNTALMVQGYAGQIVAAGVGTASRAPPLVLLTRDWFNPTLESQWFILPGLVAVLSFLMAMLVAALSLARERELGTFEQLQVTPLRPSEILIGKAVPAALVGLIEGHIVIAAAVLWFAVPLRGNIALLEATLLLYMLAGAGVGLLISALARTQLQAILGVFTIASPMVVLSGYAAPVENMPHIVEMLGRADPMRWVLVVVRGVFLQATPAALALPDLWPLIVIGAVGFAVSYAVLLRAQG